MSNSWFIYLIFLVISFGGCSAMAGGFSHLPAFLTALIFMVPLKALNDRKQKLALNEVLFYSVVILILMNLLWLRFTEAPMPY